MWRAALGIQSGGSYYTISLTCSSKPQPQGSALHHPSALRGRTQPACGTEQSMSPSTSTSPLGGWGTCRGQSYKRMHFFKLYLNTSFNWRLLLCHKCSDNHFKMLKMWSTNCVSMAVLITAVCCWHRTCTFFTVKYLGNLYAECYEMYPNS